MFYNKRVNSLQKSRGNLQFPTINKTITAISEHNQSLTIKKNSSYFQKNTSYQDKLNWLLKPSSYETMTFKQIQNEYKQLRKQLFKLNQQVGQFLNKIDKNISKKRMITMEPQKIEQVRQKQIQNNQFIIDRMKDQYSKLKNKCQTIQPKQSLQQKIQQTKLEMKLMKERLNQMKLKNKKLGDKIINTDQLFVDIHQCERQLDIWNKKKAYMQGKLSQIQKEQNKIAQSLKTIDQKSNNANLFWNNQNQKLSKTQIQLKNQGIYNQRISILQALKRSLNSISQLKQQKYHQILKQFEQTQTKTSYIQIKTQQSQIKNLEAKQQRQNLQTKYRELQKYRRQKQKYSNNDAQSIDSIKNEQISPKTKFNQSNFSSKNSTLNAFQNKKLTTTLTHKTTQKKQNKRQTEISSFKPSKPIIKTTKFVSQSIGTSGLSGLQNISDTIQVNKILQKKPEIRQQSIEKVQDSYKVEQSKTIILKKQLLNKQAKQDQKNKKKQLLNNNQIQEKQIKQLKNKVHVKKNHEQIKIEQQTFQKKKSQIKPGFQKQKQQIKPTFQKEKSQIKPIFQKQKIQIKTNKQTLQKQKLQIQTNNQILQLNKISKERYSNQIHQSNQNIQNYQQMHQFNQQVLKSKQLITATQKKSKQLNQNLIQQNNTFKFDIDLTNVKKNMESIDKKQKQKKFSSRMAVVNVQSEQDNQSNRQT